MPSTVVKEDLEPGIFGSGNCYLQLAGICVNAYRRVILL